MRALPSKLLGAFCVSFASWLSPLVQSAAAIPDVLFIVDASGSMTKRMSNGKSQMDAAIDAVSEAVGSLPPEVLVGIRTYGHRVPKEDVTRSCEDTELIMPFQAPDAAKAAQVLRGLRPRGYTPIGKALKEARTDLYDVGEGRNSERMIVLLTDGEETCGGKATEVLTQFRDEGFLVEVNIVGFNVDAKTRSELESLSTEGNGRYFDAKNSEELNDALIDAVNADNVGNCGLGSKIFDGQRGIAPQVLAAITNGSFGNQTFGITSGTSGCTQDGVISSNWRATLFIRDNKDKMAHDAAQGCGETLAALAEILAIPEHDRAHFGAVTKTHFGEIFPSEDVSVRGVIANWREVFRQDPRLRRYVPAWG